MILALISDRFSKISGCLLPCIQVRTAPNVNASQDASLNGTEAPDAAFNASLALLYAQFGRALWEGA